MAGCGPDPAAARHGAEMPAVGGFPAEV